MNVDVTRGPEVESTHQIDVVIADRSGPLVVWGDAERAVIPRSAIKYIQALPLVRTGAAGRFSVTETELVLACSSHSGEPAHTEAVEAWLRRIGLDADALECGPDLPIDDQAKLDLHRGGGDAAPILNCCSGKHTGFLSVAVHLGVDPAGYIEPDHPVQRLVTAAVEEFTGVDVASRTPGRDGCGIPTFAFPLAALAGAMSRLVAPEGLDSDTVAAASRIVGASPGREFWISGTGRRETVLGRSATEALLVKAGAEGVYMAGLPERGLGIALKARDGAGRAAEAAISATLAWLEVVPESDARWTLDNKAGDVIGEVSVAVGEPALNRL